MLTPLVWLYQGPIGLAYVAAAAVVFPLLRRLGLWEPRALDFGTDMRGKVSQCPTQTHIHTCIDSLTDSRTAPINHRSAS